MSALFETTSLPGVYSLAETGTHRQSEIESCQRLAHEVAVIMVGSTGTGFATTKRFARKGVDQRVHYGPSKDPWIWWSPGSARGQRESWAMSPAKVIWTAFTNQGIGPKIDVVFAKCRHYSTGAVRYACTDAASVEVDSRRSVRTSMRVAR